jgi:tRNA pseudouridine13 synthase
MTLFTYKTRPEDFVVTELLHEKPGGEWDFHYILFEKKGITTFMILDLMVKEFGCNRNMIGIAWLKDKHAITRQWITISRRDMIKTFGGINTVLGWLRKKWKVIDATYGETMLKLGNNAGNHFDIVLRGTKSFTEDEKKKITVIFMDLGKKGAPNYFGEQRFGFGGTNWKIGFQLLSWQIRKIDGDKNTLAEKRFKIQAFASYVFNVYLEERAKRGQLYTKLEGDIDDKKLQIVSGPVPWDDLTHATWEAGKLEQEIFKRVGLTPELLARFKPYGLYGIRRPLLMFLQNLSVTRRGDNLALSFDLASGNYATIIIDYVETLLAGDAAKPDKVGGSQYEHTLARQEKDISTQKKFLPTGEKKKYVSKNPYDKNKVFVETKTVTGEKTVVKPKRDKIAINPYTKQKQRVAKAPKVSKHRKGNKPVSKPAAV